jgi:hypothetical protein
MLYIVAPFLVVLACNASVRNVFVLGVGPLIMPSVYGSAQWPGSLSAPPYGIAFCGVVSNVRAAKFFFLIYL